MDSGQQWTQQRAQPRKQKKKKLPTPMAQRHLAGKNPQIDLPPTPFPHGAICGHGIIYRQITHRQQITNNPPHLRVNYVPIKLLSQ